MSNLWLLVRTTLRMTFRKRSSLFLYFGLPMIGILLSSLLYGNIGTTPLRIGVVNADGTQALAKETIGFVKGMGNVTLVELNGEDLRSQLAAGKLDVGLLIGEGYSDSLRKGNPGSLTIQSVKGAQVTTYVKAMLNGYLENVAAMGKLAGPDQAKFQLLYDQYRNGDFKLTAQSVNDTSVVKGMSYQSIGFLIMFMMMSAISLSDIMLKNRENRTYFRILSSPVSARVYVASNIIVNLFIMLLQISVALLLMKFVFHMDAGIPMAEMVGLLVLFGLVAVSLSLVIVTFAKSSASVGAMQSLIVTPTCLLSGCFFPISIMPDTIRRLSDFMPQSWVLQTITSLQEGESLSGLWFNLSVLAAFALVFFLVAVYRFGRNNTTRNFV
ncbi:ABC transporter permease [Paenibacillus sp. CC-CFT747]|nr:ABC transporter permease [Paenibacillus sp. CC-CFT747]